MWEKFKEYVGISEGNEIVASAEIAIRDRAASPFYGYFVISWVIINWHFIYDAFFIDQTILFDKTGLLRNEYLQSLLPTPYSWSFLFHFIIYPFLLTVAALWIFPYATRIFFRKHLQNKVALKRIELHELREEKKDEVALVKEETKLLETEIERAKTEKRATEENPERKWEREYNEFRLSPLYKDFSIIVSSIYEYNGRTKVMAEFYNQVEFQIPKDILAFSHTNDLITFDKSGEKIDLTNKGKFFVRKYSSKG